LFIVARPQITEDVISDTRSKFAIEPLEPGFGYTIGNSLRRTLLSSIPGAAVSSVRIDGVLHEFSTVPNGTEDVTDVILNLKELVIRSELEEPTTIYLKGKGPGEATASTFPVRNGGIGGIGGIGAIGGRSPAGLPARCMAPNRARTAARVRSRSIPPATARSARSGP